MMMPNYSWQGQTTLVLYINDVTCQVQNQLSPNGKNIHANEQVSQFCLSCTMSKVMFFQSVIPFSVRSSSYQQWAHTDWKITRNMPLGGIRQIGFERRKVPHTSTQLPISNIALPSVIDLISNYVCPTMPYRLR